MAKLLKFEFRKLSQSKAFYICMLVSVVLVLLSAIATKKLEDMTQVEDVTVQVMGMTTQAGFLLGTISNAMLTMIGAIFTGIFVCEDEVSGTIKNICAKGYTRSSLFVAKYITTLVAMLIFTGVAFLVSFAVGKAFFAEGTEVIQFFGQSIAVQILLVTAYHALYFMVSAISGKLGVSIAVSILGPTVISVILNVIDAFAKLKDGLSVQNYWLAANLSALELGEVTQKILTRSIVVGVIYLAIALVVGFMFYRKKEV